MFSTSIAQYTERGVNAPTASAIARMDRLVALDHGCIFEQAAHDALLRANGHYAAIWRRQSGGFIDAGDMQAAE